jgi:hypothetical protein
MFGAMSWRHFYSAPAPRESRRNGNSKAAIGMLGYLFEKFQDPMFSGAPFSVRRGITCAATRRSSRSAAQQRLRADRFRAVRRPMRNMIATGNDWTIFFRENSQAVRVAILGGSPALLNR